MIAVVRHGQTDWNLARRIQGRTEVPINETGRAQARTTGALLAAASADIDFAWRGIISSPLSRAYETASIIARELGITEVSTDEALIERDFGPAEGLTVAEARKRWPGYRIPVAETAAELAERTSNAFTRILDTAPGSVVVAHGALIRVGLGVFSTEPVPAIRNGEVWLLHRSIEAGPISVTKFERD